MAITINGSTNTLTGVAVGGLPDGIVDTDMLAALAVTEPKASGSVKGITMVDQWRLTSHMTLTTSLATVSLNLERNDSNGYAGIGTGMTESSGIFTFPTTGIYLVKMFVTTYGESGSTLGIHARIQGTKAGGSWADKAQASESVFGTGDYGSIGIEMVWDCESTSGDKILMQSYSNNAGRKILGSSTIQRTGITFIRLGDT